MKKKTVFRSCFFAKKNIFFFLTVENLYPQLALESLVVGVEGLPAVIGPCKTLPEEVPSVDRVPGLPDELIVHLVALGLHVLTSGCHFVKREGVLVALKK